MTGRGAQAESGGTRSTGQTGPAVALPRIPDAVVADDPAEGSGEPAADGDAFGALLVALEPPGAAEQPATSNVPASAITTPIPLRCRGAMTE